MGFEMIKEKYTGSIKEVTLGKGDNAVKVGGETCLPFYHFEGEIPNKPKIAMEVWDMEPPEWPEAAKAPFKDCISDPAAWAKKCVEEHGAEMIALLLRSTDPNDKNASADEAVSNVKKVLEAINVPLVVWGTANTEKDADVLKKVAEQCEGDNLVVGPIEDANHKAIGAAVMGFGHTAIGSSPIDINLAKQINILLENLGVPLDRIIIDPTTGGLGYGMEYSYSVIERIKLAALTFGDEKLQLPIINNLAFEVWKAKEAKQPLDEDPRLGDPERRAILMECVAAVCYLLAGSDVLILRHPETVRMVRSFINLVLEGGDAKDVAPINKLLSEPEIDYKSLSPEMDLTIKEEKKAAPAKEAKAPPKEEKKAAEPAKEEAKAEPAKEEKEPAAAAKAEEKPVEAAKPAEDVEAKVRAELEDKLRKEMEAKIRAEVETKAKAEVESEEETKKKAEEKARKEAEEKARKEEEERAKAEAKRKAQIEEDEKALRDKIKKSRQKAEVPEEEIVPEVPDEEMDRILFVLKNIHRKH